MYFFDRLKRFDFVILFILLLFMGISVAVLYSATVNTTYHGYHLQMMKYYILGFFVMAAISLINYRIVLKLAPYIYLLSLGLLVLVNFIGNTYHNATGWMTIPVVGMSFQPAEFFKLPLVLFLGYLLNRKQGRKLGFWRDVLPMCFVILIPFAVVMVQNDLGNALSYLVIFAGMMWIGNMKYTQAFIATALLVGAVIGGIGAYKTHHEEINQFLVEIGRQHWINRIDPWLMPEVATDDAAYHTRNAKVAIAAGGISGEGYLQGENVQSERVPFTYSDSIFVVIAEEFGFIGSSVVLLLYFVLIHRLILISLECKERAGPYLIVGIVSLFLYQIFENIGMFIGLMPLTGITLPFISYGGTSLLINMICMGLAISIRLYEEEEKEENRSSLSF